MKIAHIASRHWINGKDTLWLINVRSSFAKDSRKLISHEVSFPLEDSTCTPTHSLLTSRGMSDWIQILLR